MEALFRIGVRFADGRDETRGNPIEPGPRQTVSLASSHQLCPDGFSRVARMRCFIVKRVT